MKTPKEKAKQIKYSNVVILDTCVCRFLENDDESTWYKDFLGLKEHKTHFCISDIAATELELAFVRQSITPVGWKKIIRKLKSIISSLFPVFPGAKDFFQMAEIFENEGDITKFNYKKESLSSINDFARIAGYNTPIDVGYTQEQLESRLEKKTHQWKKIFDFCDNPTEDQIEKFRKTKLNDQVLLTKRELDKNYYSKPLLSKRADLLIQYVSKMQQRFLADKEPYNPTSKKKKNDGRDFALIIPLIFPARICTKDSFNDIKSIASYQSDWIVSPEQISAEYHATKSIKKLCFQS